MPFLRKHSVRAFAFSLMAGTAPLTLGAALPAAAQNAGQSVALAIPAQPVPRALAALSSRTGIQILYAGNKAYEITSTPVSGTYTPDQALRTLLAGTGISYRFVGTNAVTISVPGEDVPQVGAGVDGDAVLLETIDVSGSDASAFSADAPFHTPGSTAVVTREEIDRVPPSRPGDVFNSTPGVIAASKNTGGAVDVNIRGLQGMNRVKVMVDGTQQDSNTYRNYRGFDNRSYFDPELIGGIEIEKGPGTGPYSSGVIGGVVNMRTLGVQDVLLDDRAFGVRVRGSLGDNTIKPQLSPPYSLPRPADSAPDFLSMDNFTGSLAAAARGEHVDVVAAISRRQQGNYFSGTKGEAPTYFQPGTEVTNSSLDSTSVLLKGTLRWFDGQSLELGYSNYESEVGYAHPIQALFRQRQQFRLADVESSRYTARYKWESEEHSWLNLRANLWKAELFSTDPFADQPTGHLETASDSWGWEIWNTSRIDNAFVPVTLKYGAEYSVANISSRNIVSVIPAYSMLEGERKVFGAFASAEFDVTTWMKINTGIRYDYFESTGSVPVIGGPPYSADGAKVLPNASVIFTPFDGVQLFAKYAEGMRAPSVREVAGEALYETMYPNPYLRPEMSRNWEFGANYLGNDLLLEGDKARFKAVYFDNDITDYISRSTDCPIGTNCFANIDEARFKGMEISAGYDMGRAFADVAVNHYFDVELTSAGGARGQWGSAFVPPETTVALTAGLRFLDESMTLGTKVTYVGKRALPFDRSGSLYSAPFWNEHVSIVDLFGSYVVNEHMRIDVSVENVTDRFYVDALGVASMPSPGRTVRAGFTSKF